MPLWVLFLSPFLLIPFFIALFLIASGKYGAIKVSSKHTLGTMTSIEVPRQMMSENEIDRQIKELERDKRIEEIRQLRDKAKLSWITPTAAATLLPLVGGISFWIYNELKQYNDGFRALEELDKLKQEKSELGRQKNNLNIEISTLIDLKNHYEEEADRLLQKQSKLEQENIDLSADNEKLQQQQKEILKQQAVLRKEYDEIAELLKEMIEATGLPDTLRIRFSQAIRLASLTSETINRILKPIPPTDTANITNSSATLEDIKRVYEQLTSAKTVTTIPVVIHVIYRTEEENISDDQVKSQLQVINEDFRAKNSDLTKVPKPFKNHIGDAHIEFVLVNRDPDGNASNGIIRTRTTTVSFNSDDDAVKFSSSGGSDAWQPDKYLNIWVCNLSGGLIQYAQFPGGPSETDGVVVSHMAFGTTGTASAPFNKGRALTHSIAHYLNIRHIWGDDGLSCSGSDFVADTPNQAGPNFGKPKFPSISCDNGPHGDMFMNFADYVNDDSMYMFTKGQVVRMHDTLNGPRKSLGSKRVETIAQTDK